VNISRIVPYLESDDFGAVKDFYVGLLGLEHGMDEPSFIDFASPTNPSAQVVVVAPGFDQQLPRFAIDVGDPATVDAVHAKLVAKGFSIVYLLTTEPWGIRRFFVRDPTGAVVSIIAHVG
jgi:catechol 2,3-dioxygenase-like lactoylglutathione lyase family enzyme